MFAPDPGRAAREIRRVLRPGGRAALAVWGRAGETPGWGSCSTRSAPTWALRCRLPACRARSRSMTPTAWQHCSRMPGFTEVDVGEQSSHALGSFDEWWTRTCALAGPVTKVLSALPDEAVAALATAHGRRPGLTKRPNGVQSSPGSHADPHGAPAGMSGRLGLRFAVVKG